MKRFVPVLMLSIVVLSHSLFPAESYGQARNFPYEAALQAERIEVRSGPGNTYYATGVIKKGDTVTVHRHDPGGWYMISPPNGSFSWIRADNVQKQNANTGKVIANNVIVRVGSSISEHREVEQRRMMNGDQVRIIGQQEFPQNNRSILYYKIQSPRGEFRWVKGNFLIPVNARQRQQHDADPFSIPSNANIEPIADNDAAFGQTQIAPDLQQNHNTTDVGDATAFNNSSATQVANDRQILTALDNNFRTMIRNDISTWKFRDLEHDYKKLHSQSATPAFAHQVDLRIAAVDRYKKMKSEHDDFVRLTRETAERDAQLLSMRNQAQNLGQFPTTNVGGETVMKPTPDSPPTLPGSETIALNESTQHQNTHQPTTTVTENPTPTAADFERLSGAGIIQRATPIGRNTPTPTHALMTPSGRILTYLHTDGSVNLDGALGRSMGIYGKRIYDKRLNADVIVVEGIAPVQLSR